MIIPLVDEKKRIHGVAMCWQLEKVISRKDRDTWEPFKWFTDFDKAMCVATANAVPAPHPAHTITSALNALAHALQARADEFVASSGVTRSVMIQIDSKKRIRKTPICWQLEKRVSNKKKGLAWKGYKWFGTCDQALREAAITEIQMHPAASISGALEAIAAIRANYESLLDASPQPTRPLASVSTLRRKVPSHPAQINFKSSRKRLAQRSNRQ